VKEHLAVPIVDTRCHVSEVYYEPVEVLLFQMDRAKVFGETALTVFPIRRRAPVTAQSGAVCGTLVT